MGELIYIAIGVIIFFWILYEVIRRAVRAGIMDAQREMKSKGKKPPIIF